MDMNSDTMLRAKVMAMAQLGVVVDRIDLTIPAIWLSLPERSERSKNTDGKPYPDYIAKRLKDTILGEGLPVTPKVHYRVRKSEMWSEANANFAQRMVSNCINNRTGWPYTVYREYLGAVNAERTAATQDFVNRIRNMRGGQNTSTNSEPKIIDIKNLADD